MNPTYVQAFNCKFNPGYELSKISVDLPPAENRSTPLQPYRKIELI